MCIRDRPEPPAEVCGLDKDRGPARDFYFLGLLLIYILICQCKHCIFHWWPKTTFQIETCKNVYF